jgi:hypothetical protein
MTSMTLLIDVRAAGRRWVQRGPEVLPRIHRLAWSARLC